MKTMIRLVLLLALADDGGWALAYLPAGGTIEVDLGRLRGPVGPQWFDPSSGKSILAEGPLFANRGRRSFTAPGKNADGDSDWVLALETETKP